MRFWSMTGVPRCYCNTSSNNVIQLVYKEWSLHFVWEGAIKKTEKHPSMAQSAMWLQFPWHLSIFFLQAHSHVKKVLYDAPLESVVRVTGTVISRPPGQKNPVSALKSSWDFLEFGTLVKCTEFSTEIWQVDSCCTRCVIALPLASLFSPRYDNPSWSDVKEL